MNYCYKNYPSVIKNGGFNGYGKKKSVEEIAKEVIDGKWGTVKNERKNCLPKDMTGNQYRKK